MKSLFFLLIFLGFSGPALAQEPPSCEHPQVAADTLLALLQPDNWRPEQAASCLNLPPDRAAEGPELAVRLKRVLDSQGLWVPVPELPTDPQYVDEAGREFVPLVDELPEVYLEKVGDRWLYSEATVEAIPGLYKETFSGVGAWLQLNLPPKKILGLDLWQWVLGAWLLLGGWLLSFLTNLILRRRVLGWVEKLNLPFRQEVFAKTIRPMNLLVLSLVLYLGISELQLSVRTSQALLFVGELAMSVSVVWLSIRWISVFSDVFERRAARSDSRLDDQLVPMIARASQVAAVALGVVFVLQNMGVDVGSLIAGLGIGGLAVALAAQQTLANLFGSLTIFLDRTFQVGDWVILQNGIEGVVESIGFRSTRIRTFGNSVVSVPNGEVANGFVNNMGERQFRRLKLTIGVSYSTPPDTVQAFVEGVRAILSANDDVRQDFYEVHFRDFGASSLDILVYSFLDVPDWHAELDARARILLEIMRLAEDLEVSFAFPSTSVYVESTPERPIPAAYRLDAATLGERAAAFGPGGARARPEGPRITHGFNADAATQRGSEAK